MKNKRRQTIVNILNDTFPPELRVGHVVQGLWAAGYGATILAHPTEITGTVWEDHVLPIASPHPVSRLWRAGRRRILSWIRPAFYDSVFQTGWIKKQIRDLDAQAIIWNDLAGAHVGLQMARQLDIKFIVDMHENYPYNMWSTERDKGIRARRYSLSPWFEYEKFISERADLILTPGREMNERLNGMHFIPHEKMIEFLNAEAPEVWDARPQVPTPLDDYKDRDIILYVGGCSVHRGLDVIIRAMARITEVWPSALFAIVGDGRAIPLLKVLAKEENVEQSVLFVGRRPFEEVASYIRQSIIGVVPHLRYGQTDNGAPHKLFQYMSLNRPVLVSNCAGPMRIVSEHDAGLVFQSGNVQEAAEQLLRLRDKKLRERLGKNGRRAAEGPLHIRRQQERFVARLTELLS